ncbi:MAG: hypothetical protein GY699_25585 [Desulfobacteraceae bacterium]|nr:hypothetical protein [Desulfobacteraceae bacterium]
MEKKEKGKQTLIRVSFGIGVILFALLIEMLAIHPSGIYYYSHEGYKEFKIGTPKTKVLKRINKRKTIRKINTCDPESLFERKTRKRIELEGNLISSNYWIAHDRTGKDFLFIFKNDMLEKVLIQRLRFGKKDGSIIFLQCIPDIVTDFETYLSEKEKLTIYFDSES